MAAIRASSFVTSTILYYSFFLVHQACADDVTTVIDDSHPDIKSVSGNWIHFTGAEYYNGTETLTKDAGATTLYMFNGTSISVFGTECDPAGGNETVSTYTVDGGSPSKHTVPRGTVCNQNFVNFYSSPPLPNGRHTLVITNLNNGAWFFLDFFKVTSPGNSSSSSSSSSSSTSSSSSVASSPSGTPAESTTQSSKSSKISTGAIAGVVVGAVALLAFIILGVLLWKRTKRRRTYIDSPLQGPMLDADVVQPVTLTPYLPPSNSLTTQSSGKYNGGDPRIFASTGSYPQTLSTRADMPTVSASSVSQVTESESLVEPSLVQSAIAESQHVEPVNRRYSITTIPPAYEK